LAITKRLIELHDGRIVMESRLGIGTMVEITLPRYQSGLDAAAEMSA
jgi:signal transduction histidine kinase